jgi:hypothetical protein
MWGELSNTELQLQSMQQIVFSEEPQRSTRPEQVFSYPMLQHPPMRYYGNPWMINTPAPSLSRDHQVAIEGIHVTYEFILETSSSLVDSSILKSHPPSRVPTRQSSPTHITSRSEWTQHFEATVDDMLIGLALGKTRTEPIELPFRNEEYAAEVLNWSAVEFKRCFL